MEILVRRELEQLSLLPLDLMLAHQLVSIFSRKFR